MIAPCSVRGSTSEPTDFSGPKRLKVDPRKVVLPIQPIHELYGLPTYPLDLERRALVVNEKLIHGGILGICGMGGIGKTTLAMQIFNTISQDFEYTCFVDNVKGIPSHDLQDRVLNQFHHNGKKSVRGSTQWSDLQTKKALIVMDDVDKENQLKALPKLEHFAVGSCIIITSRNTQVCKYYERCIVHEVDLLEHRDAKRLICQYAFGSQDVPEYLTHEVNALVRKCDGLPLTLEVIGKYLHDHSTDVEVWTETLHRLREAQAITGELDDSVWASLRISYDALLPEEQETFIEAALFFFEEPLDDALAAWSTATETMHTTWRKLVSRSLVKEFNKRVWVHEHLRDLAHNISKEIMVSGTNDEANSAVDLLNDNQVEATTKYLRIQCYSPGFKKTLQLAALDELKGLKYMDLAGVHSEGLGTGFTTEILYLRFHSSNMSEFNLSLNKMQNLAVLDLSNFRIPDKFPDALGTLTNLRILRLSELEGFDHLPENFGNFSQLRRLEVRNLRSLTLPENFGGLIALQVLTIEEADELQTLPDSFSRLESLQTLTLHCDILEKLPKNFGNLSLLEHLSIRSRSMASLPESFGGLHHLKTLKLWNAKKLTTLPENFGRLIALQDLTIDEADELQTLPDSFFRLQSLQELTLHCSRLERLPKNFGNLSSLRKLSIRSRRMASLPESIQQLHALKKLRLVAGKNAWSLLEGSRPIASLQEIEFNCDGLEDTPNLFDSLRCLAESMLNAPFVILKGWRTHILPAGLGGLSSLRALTLRVLPRLETLPDELGTLSALERLTIKYCHELKSLPDSLGQLSSLKEVSLWGCNRLETLPESWGESGGLQVAAVGGVQMEERRVQGEESSHTKQTNEMLLKVNACPLLDEATMESLGWTCVASEWGTNNYRRKLIL